MGVGGRRDARGRVLSPGYRGPPRAYRIINNMTRARHPPASLPIMDYSPLPLILHILAPPSVYQYLPMYILPRETYRAAHTALYMMNNDSPVGGCSVTYT